MIAHTQFICLGIHKNSDGLKKFQFSEFNLVLKYIYRWCSIGTFFLWSFAYFGSLEFKGVVLVEVLYFSKDIVAFSALCVGVTKVVSERRELSKFGSNCSVDPIFQDILPMIEAITVFRLVSVVSGVTKGLGSFVAVDPSGGIAGEVGES